MKKIISFSLWGNDPKYVQGIIKNIELIPKIYPGWESIVYIGSSVKSEQVKNLNTRICYVDENTTIYRHGAYWRFLPIFEENDSYIIFRDADSRISMRESEEVRKWIDSGLLVHNIKDHPNHHHFPIMAGMWGIRTGVISISLKDMIMWANKVYYLSDQHWLSACVYPVTSTSMYQSYLDGKTIDFVGQSYTENNIPIYGNNI